MEASAAAQSIGEQATNLSQEASFFNIVAGSRGTTALSAPSPPVTEILISPGHSDSGGSAEDGWEEF